LWGQGAKTFWKQGHYEVLFEIYDHQLFKGDLWRLFCLNSDDHDRKFPLPF